MDFQTPLARFAGSLMVVALAAAAGSCSSGGGGSPFPVGTSPPPGGLQLTPEIGSIQDNVLTPSCATSGCHTGADAPLGLRLEDVASSYALLVGIPSGQVPSLMLVDPGNPSGSYLVQKLEGSAAAGERMPASGPPFLSRTTVNIIRQWITDGALPPSEDDMDPPQVVSIEPADGAALAQLPAVITIVFSRDMDGSLFNDTTVVLTRAGGDGTFVDGNEEVLQPAAIMLDAANARMATIDLSGIDSVDDDYEVRLVGTGGMALASLDGEILDGDADGEAGGDFVSTFNVSADNDVFAVVAISPANGAVEIDFPSSITVTFSADVDVATVDANSFVLERSGGDGAFDDGNEAPVDAPVSAAGNQATMDLSGILPSFEDTYRVMLSETILDLAGNMLDGDGDAIAGGNFVSTFQTDLTTYTDDTQPIFLEKCDTCHTVDGLGGHNIGMVYADALKPAVSGDCDGLTIGECTIVLVQQGDMPQGAECEGDPEEDEDNDACLTQTEQDALQAWIDDRLPE